MSKYRNDYPKVEENWTETLMREAGLTDEEKEVLVTYSYKTPPCVGHAFYNEKFTDYKAPDEVFGNELAVPDRKKTASDGLSTDYYALPEHATELRHLISHKGMSKSRGDIFKACYRLGEKDGTAIEYDLNKMKFFIDDLIEMNKRGELL